MDRPWKKMERNIATIFHTTRRLMKGTNAVSDIGDDDFPLVLDCKKRKKETWVVTQWFKKIETVAVKEGKWPVLVLQEPGKVRKYAFVRRAPLMKLILERTDISADRFYTVEHSGNQFPVLLLWDKVMKEVQIQRKKRGHDVHPILMVKNEKADLELAILQPTVLSWIFVKGGVIDGSDTGEDSEGQEKGSKV